MGLPKVTILFSNGNLLQDIAALDGIAALVGTGSTAELLGVPTVVYSLADAEEKGFTEDAEPDMHRHLKEFYGEVAGNQELHIMIVPDTMTLEDMVDNTVAGGAKKLIAAAQGKVRLLGIFRNPPGAYDGGEDFIDADVAAALITSKVFAQARLTDQSPLGILIEGRVENPAAANTLQPKTSSNGFAGVVLGGTLSDGSASVGLALGRAVKYGAEIKIGKVASGPLSITTCYIGNKLLKDVTNLATLHEDGFISFMTHPQKAGFYFGIDRMATTGDDRYLAYRRVLDKAAIIAFATYTERLEGEINIDATGKIDSLALKALEAEIEQQIILAMGSQISGVEVYINPDQNLINDPTLRVKLRIRPFGYMSFIEVDLGLTSASN